MNIPQIKKIIEVGNKRKGWTDKVCLSLDSASRWWCGQLVCRRPGISIIRSFSICSGKVEVTHKFLKSMTRKEVIAFREDMKRQFKKANGRLGYD